MLHNPVSSNPVFPDPSMLEAAGDGHRTHRLSFSIESILSIQRPSAKMFRDRRSCRTPSPVRMSRERGSSRTPSPTRLPMRTPNWAPHSPPKMPMEKPRCWLPPAPVPRYVYPHRLIHNYPPVCYYSSSSGHPPMVHPQLPVRVPGAECPCSDPYCNDKVLPYPYCMATTDSSLSWRTRPSKSKRIRTVFTPEQLEKLEAEFIKQQYMVGTERVDLAATLNLTETQVKVWFQNRRIKWRKQSLEQKKAKLSQFGVIPKDPSNQSDVRDDEEYKTDDEL